MSLEKLIQMGNYASPEEAYAAINAKTVQVRDNDKYTWAGVADLIGPQAAEKLRLAFDSSGFGWVSLQLGGLGLPLSDDRVQQVLLGLDQAGVPGCAILAAHGVSVRAPWEVENLPGAPTQQEVQAVWERCQQVLKIGAIKSRLDAAFNQIGTNEQMQAIAEFRAIANELEG